MKILIDLRESQTDELIEAVGQAYEEALEVISLGDQPIAPCIGCWSCWLKTPGKCVHKDHMTASYSHYVNSDTVILLLDTAQGFINHQAKAFFDRTIPHYHPYIELVTGECHHVARYERYPDLVFHFDMAELTESEEMVIEDYLARTAFHFKSQAFRLVGSENDLQLKPLKPRKANNRVVPFGSVESMERLVIYNGSPRRGVGNTALILEALKKTLGDRLEIRDLKKTDQWEEWAESFTRERHVMFFMPLYVHAMPSHVMAFFEKIQPSKGSISFFVQSGFPESSQSHYLEAYFEQLSLRLGRTYLGTAIKGSTEGLHLSDEKTREKIIQPFVKTVDYLVMYGKYNPTLIQQLARPVRFGKVLQMIINLVGYKLINAGWDQQLKANNAFEKSFDQPYWLL